ncbi:MAG: hypothetical protein H3C31_09930 [Brumimicrobium sp.]|nr:hypothetical protein [Brumimicrobium sp.]MCO5269569.1 hypothetical protein [Brumimicrobium sp.]
MKNILLFSIGLLSLTLISCKKEWNCTCTGDFGKNTVKMSKESHTKSEAKQACEMIQYDVDPQKGYVKGADCKLK